MINIKFCFKFLTLSRKKFKRGFNKSGISIFGISGSYSGKSGYNVYCERKIGNASDYDQNN